MVRPIRDDHLADRLVDSWRGPDGYPEWFDGRRVDGDTLADRGDHLRGYDSAFVYRPAFSVDLGALTSALADRLVAAGVHLARPCSVDHLEQTAGGWRIGTAGGETIGTDRVVLALGHGLGEWFETLAMRSRGGELVHFPTLDADRLGHILNADGQVSPHPRGGVTAGASWWDPADFSARDDAAATRDILDRCASLYPPIAEADTSTVWRGVRAIYGDNQPLVGPVAGFESLDIFGAFGSKGLLRIPYHATQFAHRLLDRPADIPELSRTTRMGADNWEPVVVVMPSYDDANNPDRTTPPGADSSASDRSETLEEPEQEAKRLFEVALDLLCVADPDGYFLQVNPAFEDVLGYTEDELLSRPIINFVHPDDRERTVAALEQLGRQEDVTGFSNRYICKDGSIVWLEWQARAYSDGERIYASARNITDLKRARRERDRLEVKFQEAQKLESVALLAGGIAHDFNNLLTTILGNTGLILMDLDDDNPLHDRAESIQRSASTAADLCEQLLAYAGKGQFDVQPADLSAIVRETD
ncbi:MAG: FAD-dependent oxidoreductase, partial [Bradymonadaceae bacterium]